ncbi:MAG: 23S rRNA (adenine2030-N6)-methyltransferase [Paraglaciecola sp.]
MFSYRHSFHAGNHGDVLKHICQMLIINKLKSKDKGFVYIDTHSGAGLYDLAGDEAKKTNEYAHGIARVSTYQGNNQAILDYQALCAKYLRHNQYPGSPEIANSMLREQDSAVLMEWHNQEIDNLKNNIRGTNVAIHHRDGYEGLIAMTPPRLPRGMVLIDPSYEVADEYQQVVDTVSQTYKRWTTGIYAIWYPLLSSRVRSAKDDTFYASGKSGLSEQMLASLAQQNFKNLLTIEMCVADEDQYAGMYGTGMAIINAPWQLDEQMQTCLEELTPLLSQGAEKQSQSANGQPNKASFSIKWLLKDRDN